MPAEGLGMPLLQTSFHLLAAPAGTLIDLFSDERLESYHFQGELQQLVNEGRRRTIFFREEDYPHTFFETAAIRFWDLNRAIFDLRLKLRSIHSVSLQIPGKSARERKIVS
jgi:hypothetical protein